MSSAQAHNSSPPIRAPSTSSRSPTSISSRSEKSDSPVGNPAGTEDVAAASEKLLNGAKDVREIIRLVQCGVCSRLLHNPTTLSCGRSCCQSCIPPTYLRTNISWPATANRLYGFECPFEDCRKEHAIGDCSVDVTLNKVLDIIRAAVEQGREATLARNVSTRVTIIDEWGSTGVSSLDEKGAAPQAVKGGRIVSTYTLVEHGKLKYSCEVSYAAIGATEEEVTESDVAAFTGLKEMVRTEMDCQICYALFLDPITTACGHTFCRNCLHRTLSNSEHCPICRRTLSIQPQVPSGSAPSNQRLAKMINGFWADIIAVRAQTVRSELQAELSGEFDIPIFVCTLSFPAMPTFLHVFEPRYRRMVRRAMEGDRTFGMVLGSSSTSSDGRNFCEIGTLLRIVNIEFFPDGRSLLESVGVSRFRVLRHGVLDDYVVGKIEKIDDVSLADEEAMEISETMNGQGVRDFVQSSITQPTTSPDQDAPQQSEESNVLTVQDLETKSTRELLEIGITFVGKMRAQSVSWLTARVLAVFGHCPNDPALFPWWFASVLPVSDEEKYRLLGTSSVRQRMKICCRWIVEWEASRW
ncbi:ATP-dependent protease La domain-containing protein [Pestalotiopsis sp. NC0098]|nr:ATP-dependent protease La domain-containing protein [Pestalotiopsis sp. NC0098]